MVSLVTYSFDSMGGSVHATTNGRPARKLAPILLRLVSRLAPSISSRCLAVFVCFFVFVF